MKDAPHFHRLLKMKTVTSTLQHDDVVIGHVREDLVVELCIKQYLSLERLVSIDEQTRSREGRFELVSWREPIDVLLVFIYGGQVDFEGTILIQVEQ